MLFVLGVQKYNQNNLATLQNFSDLTLLSGFFGHDLDFKLYFEFGPGSCFNFRVRAGFGPKLVGPFTTLNALTRGGFTTWHSAWNPALRWYDFFSDLHLYLARDFAKISKVPGAPRTVNLARSITWLVSVTIYCTFFQ